MASNMVTAAIPFLLLPAMTRYLSPEEYGQVAMFQVMIGGLGAFVGLNVVGAASRKYYDENPIHVMNEYITTCLHIIIASGIAVFCLLFAFKTPLSQFLGLDPEWILWCVFVVVVSSITQLQLGQWIVRKNAKKYAIFQILQSIVIMSLSLLFVVMYKEGVWGRVAAQIIGASIGGAVALFSLYKDDLLGFFVWNPVYAREALSFGVPLIPHVAGLFLLMSIDRLIVNVELGLAEAGIYAVASQIAYAMVLIFDAVNKAYVPCLYEKLKDDVFEEKCRIVRNTYVWFGFIFAIVGCAFLVGPEIIVWIAGEKYAAAAKLVGWLALGQGFVGMYLMVTNYIFYSRRTGLLSLTTICSGILNVALLFLFIRFFGVTGAPIAFCIAMCFRFIVTWVVAQKQYPMPWFSFILK